MKVLNIIVGFILAMIGLGALSQVHDGMALTVAGLNLSDYSNAEFNMIPLAVLFVCVVGSVLAIVSAFGGKDER